MRGNPKIWVAAAVAIVVLGLVGWLANRALWTHLYPFRYREEILTYSRQNGLDPLFVASIIKNESRFDATAVSSKGAIGLMQVMPETGRWIAKRLGFKSYDPDMLRDPATNVKIGTWYLAELKREFGGKVVLVVAAYNCGRGRVREWAREDGAGLGPSVTAELAPWPGEEVDEDFPISKIALRETRDYVRSVLASLRRYRRIYSDVLQVQAK